MAIRGDVDGDGRADITPDAGGGGSAAGVLGIPTGKAAVDGVNVTNGYANHGGGIAVSSGATLDFSNGAITHNSALTGGGLANAGTTTLTNATAAEITAGHLQRSAAHIRTGTEKRRRHGRCRALRGGTHNAGGFDVFHETEGRVESDGPRWWRGDMGRASLFDTELSANHADVMGGGIYNAGGMRLTDSSVQDNVTFRWAKARGDAHAEQVHTLAPIEACNATVTPNKPDDPMDGLSDVLAPAPEDVVGLFGAGGRDVLSGTGADDLVEGLGGDDVLRSGGDADHIDGGRGDDTVAGGAGSDQFLLTPRSGRDVIEDFELGSDELILARGPERAELSSPEDFEALASGARASAGASIEQRGPDAAITFASSGATLILRDVVLG